MQAHRVGKVHFSNTERRNVEFFLKDGVRIEMGEVADVQEGRLIINCLTYTSILEEVTKPSLFYSQNQDP